MFAFGPNDKRALFGASLWALFWLALLALLGPPSLTFPEWTFAFLTLLGPGYINWLWTSRAAEKESPTLNPNVPAALVGLSLCSGLLLLTLTWDL